MSCEGVFPSAAETNTSLYITDASKAVEPKRLNWVVKTDKTITIKTNVGVISVDLTKFCSLKLPHKVSTVCQLEFVDKKATFNSPHTEYEVVYDSQQRPLCCHISQTSNVIIDNLLCVKVNAKLAIYYTNGNIITNVSLHNTRSIATWGGKWDLGDENSLYIKSLALIFNYEGKGQQLFTLSQEDKKRQEDKKPYDYAQLTQYSSGGDNWQSENHKTRRNKVELQHKGAKGSVILKGQTTEFETLRSQPFIEIALEQSNLFIQAQHFWQKYPCGLRSSSKRTVIDFADQKSGCEVELQPGEIKSHTLGFSVANECSLTQLKLSNCISLDLSNTQQSQAIPFLTESLLQHPLQNLFHDPNGESSYDHKWLAKREALDEFGWRNFGDLFADHEAAHYEGDGIFVSHYNNQYDPLFGFLKLWILTGKSEYKTLADDLFDHTFNIDIYHTVFDKPEYNKGLFWHTDHYVPAETASHRTYSVHQECDVYIDHIGGGGPGSHHCYSTGLAFYYLLTGNQKAKQATVDLAQWMQQIYEGDGTLLGLVIRAKNANYLKFPLSNKLLLGSGTGVVRNVFTNKYPLDRGTGNNVNVLLDSFDISQQQSYLRQAEFVILNTISSQDDISKRDFNNIEETWFYTVFLQAVAKYLYLISQGGAMNKSSAKLTVKDKTTSAIKAAFIHYATWMSENETHYLANKDSLEYPNDTWTGQDLRKIQILLCAFELTHSETMLRKANELSDYVYPSLLSSKERNYTRIQVLSMQNFVDLPSVKNYFEGVKQLAEKQQDLSGLKQNKRYFARVITFLKQYSISREIGLLCVRIPAFKKVFNK